MEIFLTNFGHNKFDFVYEVPSAVIQELLHTLFIALIQVKGGKINYRINDIITFKSASYFSARPFNLFSFSKYKISISPE